MAPYTLADFLQNESVVRQQLETNTFPGHIPLLNYWPAQNFPDHSLVRFRGMVQDMWDPEYYLEEYVVKRTDGSGGTRVQNGRYRDTLVLQVKPGNAYISWISNTNRFF